VTPRGLLASLGLDLPPLQPGRPGDPGLFGPGSIVWRVGRERILLAGGPAALLLQVAHPLVAAGVANHSDFRADPFRRLQATLDATLRITFGDRDQALAAAEAVGRVHARVQGRLDRDVGPFAAGTSYDAGDPNLALWVHASLLAASLRVYGRFVRPLGSAERERYYQEAKPFARLFGVGDEVLPPDYPAFRAYLARMVEGPELSVGEEARELAAQILAPPTPLPARPAVPALRGVTAWVLPARLRRDFGLSWGPAQAALVAGMAGSSRLALRAVPAGLRYWPHHRVARARILENRERRGPLRRF
jgi:uncharacterized protein (DUF2236 family)